MEQLNKNRLIGGVVLLLAGLLFVPAILTPNSEPLSNPQFGSDTASPQVVIQQPEKTTTIPEVAPLTLESIDQSKTTGKNLVAATVPKTTNPVTKAQDLLPEKSTQSQPMVAIKLESLAQSDASKPRRTGSNSKSIPESWVRVGSFSNLDNADKLAEQLKRRQYSVKIENTTISGKSYRRVLIGPFRSEKDLSNVLEQIRSEGFSPSIQR